MVAHSIIIPHRDRQATLEVCLFAIARSARITTQNSYEVVVVDNGSQDTKFMERLGATYPNVRWLSNRDTMVEFNKPRLQNTGIEKSRGKVLTFLDADAVVGDWFMSHFDTLLQKPEVTKLCYRVRLLPTEQLKVWHNATAQDAVVANWFDDYDHWFRAYEAYGEAHSDSQRGKEGDGILFGNSHYSIRRDVLGDIRYDESMVGHGYEDLLQLWYLQQRLGDAYNPVLVDDSILCLQHLYHDNRWLGGDISRRNEKMYHAIIEGRVAYQSAQGMESDGR